ncbi:MAG: NAD(+) diphosphatase [Desulfopila sp.]|jgi:NAD+ diphosphatase|nr:NAD(+) diphosphatase [Desulfopila sp.]
MTKKYYIFQKNKVVNKISKPMPLPFTATEQESLCTESSLQIRIQAGDDQDMVITELPERFPLPPGYELVPLRSLLGVINDRLFKQWGKAAQLLHWYTTNRYCGSCGAQTIDHAEEPARLCPNCETIKYPQVSPCIIVLIHHHDSILLARSPRFPNNMYSTLAGFVEPGESAEECLHREIYEEVRLYVDNIRYFTSQSWPFPGQLMLGFFAEYVSGNITVDGIEICDAQWYKHNNLPVIPGKDTLAGQLIRHHFTRKFHDSSWITSQEDL